MQELKAGDHVIVDGGFSHGLADGWDGTIISAAGSWPFVEGWGRRTNQVTWQYVSRNNLIKVDDLVTHPERIYKTGDRVLVTGNTSKCTHYLTVGTDAEVISDKGFDNWRPELYRVRGLGLYGAWLLAS